MCAEHTPVEQYSMLHLPKLLAETLLGLYLCTSQHSEGLQKETGRADMRICDTHYKDIYLISTKIIPSIDPQNSLCIPKNGYQN